MKKLTLLCLLLLCASFACADEYNIYATINLANEGNAGQPFSDFVGADQADIFGCVGPGFSGTCISNHNFFSNEWHPYGLGYNGGTFGATLDFGINAGAGGTLTWAVQSDDGAQLFIDGNLVIDDGGSHADEYMDVPITLSAGFHTVHLDYFECCGDPGSQVTVGIPDGVTETPEPGSILLLGTGLAGVAGAIRRKLNK